MAVPTNEPIPEPFFTWAARPAIIWISGIGFAYASFLEPMARFVAQVAFHYTGQFPTVDSTITMQTLFAVLGVSGLRSYDKKKKLEADVATTPGA